MTTPELLKREVEIIMPDGSSVIAPSNVSPEEVKARWEMPKLEEARQRLLDGPGPKPTNWSEQIQQIQGQMSKAKAVIDYYESERGSGLDKAAYQAKKIGKAALKGIGSAVLFPAEILGSGGFIEGMQDAIGSPPVTRNEQTIDTIIQSASGGLAGAPRQALMKNAGIGATVGTGVDVGLRASGDQPLGGLAGGGAALVASLLPSYARVSKEALAKNVAESASEESFLKAQAAQKQIADTGMSNVNLSQVMPENSAVDELVAALAQSPQGKKTQQQLQRQPLDTSIVAEDLLAGIRGDVRSPQQIANLEQEIATQAQKQIREKAGQQYAQALPEDKTIPPVAMQKVMRDLNDLKKGLSPTEADLVDDAIASLKTKEAPAPQGPQILDATGTPMNQAPVKSPYLTDANQIKTELDFALESYGQRKLNTPSLDAKLDRVAQKIREVVRPVTDTKLGKANEAFSTVMRQEMDPLKQSIGGRMAGKAGYQEGVEAARSKLMQAFDRGVDPLSKNSEILEAQKVLSKVENGNEVFRDSFKTWLSGKISEASKASQGRLPEDVAQNFEKFFGNPANPSHASQGMKDAFVALARSEGLPDDSLLKGLKHAQILFSAAARRPGKVGATSKELRDMADTAAQGAIGTEAMQKNFVIRKFNEWRYEEALQFFDELVTTPEGVDTLLELSKSKNLSPRAYKTLGAFMALQAGAEQDSAKIKEEK